MQFYSDACIPVTGTITVATLPVGGRSNSKKVTFKNCDPFTGWISKINNTQVDNIKDIDTEMSMHSLIEYSNKNIRKFMPIL